MTTFKKRKNKFSKIKHHLKSSQIDEKLELLNEIPTNNISGIYFIEPEKIEITPAVLADLNLSTDSNADGTDTSGLFGDNGEILTDEPPGDTSYILGPMISVYFPDGDYTAVGYVQENTRKVINLARISGPINQWNGVDGFISYSQLTLEQANWYKDQFLTNKVQDYRVFYIGIFETIQSQVYDPGVGVDIDVLGRWFGKIIKTPKTVVPQITNRTPAVMRGPDPNLPPGSANPKKKKSYQPQDSLQNPNLIGRAIRSGTDPIRYAGNTMYQGNPMGRTPGLSNYWSPDPRTAGTYTNPGNLKGIPGSKPSSSGTLTQAPRPSYTPKVTRSVLGQPQFKFPSGSPPPANMITSVADDIAVNSAAKAASKTSTLLGKAVPFLSIGVSVADATYRASRGDYMGAILSGLSAIPGPLGWSALGLQVITDATGKTGVQNESYDNYDYDVYINGVVKIAKQKNIKLNKNALLSAFLRIFANEKRIDDNDKSMLVAIIQGDVKEINQKDIIDFIKRIHEIFLEGNISVNEKRIINIYEQRQRIIRDLKKPVVLPEAKKERIKYRPRVIGAPSRTVGQDLMKQAEVPTSFKPLEEKMWGKHEKMVNSRLSQERKNMILDIVGTSDHAWEWLTEKNQIKSKDIMYGNFDIKKNFGKDSEDVKDKIISKEQIGNDYLIKMLDNNGKIITLTQSVLNERLHKKFEMEMLEQQTLNADKDPLLKRVANKLKPIIDYEDKPSKLGYPDQPPPEMINGWHPEYGKKVDYYKKLDNKSADIMNTMKTNDAQIDSEVEKQTSKSLSSRLKTHIGKNK